MKNFLFRLSVIPFGIYVVLWGLYSLTCWLFTGLSAKEWQGLTKWGEKLGVW